MNGQKHTYRYAAICIISELYFRQFCRAFGLREIIVMLIILICYSATLYALLYFGYKTFAAAKVQHFFDICKKNV